MPNITAIQLPNITAILELSLCRTDISCPTRMLVPLIQPKLLFPVLSWHILRPYEVSGFMYLKQPNSNVAILEAYLHGPQAAWQN